MFLARICYYIDIMTHKHHIIPKHAGGTDEPSNIEYVTVEQHAERHRILFETHGRWQDKVAWLGLSGRIGKEEIIRLRASESLSYRLRHGDLRGMWIGKKQSPQSNMSRSRTQTGMRKSATHCEKIGEALRGKPKSTEHKRKLSLGSMGNTRKAKSYLVTFPDGTQQIIKGLTKFGRDQGFPPTSLFNVTRGIVNSYKGFKVSSW